MSERVRLVVLFGGRSAEHEVSCVSAVHVLNAVDLDRYDVIPVGITHDGRWVLADEARAALERGGAKELPASLSATGPDTSPETALALPSDGRPTVVLPLLHGPFGEDGTVQGLLELTGVPYVGAGVLGSALAMDKAKAKEVLAHAGLAQARYIALPEWEVGDDLGDRVEVALGWPVFVKPSNLGSSVGVSKVDGPEAFVAAVELALGFDEWILVEEAVKGREIEVAVLGNRHPEASVPGEVVPGGEFYDYEDKYLEDRARLMVPAPLSPEATGDVRQLAIAAFKALRVEGMARVDFFYEENGRGFLVNEVNTIPGFTPISMYPRLWEASGVSYSKLVDRLVELALEKSERRRGRIGRPR
jgi:D-alanine-D-alanine ligase